MASFRTILLETAGKSISWFKSRKRRTRLGILACILIGLAWGFCLPRQLFQDPYSTVLLDREGELLGARIAHDGQWRFPGLSKVPEKFATSIIAFEDKRFYSHPGIDPFALGRAIWLNLSHGEVRSGGSTLTMQVIRLARKGKSRTVLQKLIEIFQATRLELSSSKQEILTMYAAHAPFGGNVVGLEAASWRYFGRSASELSWAESATLAVLPNAPALIHPGRNRQSLLSKRNFLLDKLLESGEIDSLEWELSIAEPIPEAPRPIPQLAPHLLERVKKEHGNALVRSTLELQVQSRANELVAVHHRRLRQNGIHNAAMLVASTSTGEVLAYVGNTTTDQGNHGNRVDIVTAPRSTGSILKPFLYAAMLEEGEILPNMLVADVPSFYGSFSPVNYDRSYRGAVPAGEALARSLNIPAVRMLYKHGVHRFYERLKRMGMTTLFRSSEGYGLSLILGGAEGNLWDIAGMYASMARTLGNFQNYNGLYEAGSFRPLVYRPEDVQQPLPPDRFTELLNQAPLGAGAVYHTFEAMQEVNRPGEEATWRNFGSSRRVAWKTGTSYGFRDAWSVGVVPGYVVAVWVGNADGEGRPGLIGSEAAAPLMFDMMSSLPDYGSWFPIPFDDLDSLKVCRESGHRASNVCPHVQSILAPLKGVESEACGYHQLVWLSDDRRTRVHADCELLLGKNPDSLFVLPALQGEYYAREHPSYRPVPPYRHDCILNEKANEGGMSLAYPKEGARILIPVTLEGARSGLALEAFHQTAGASVFWHLDHSFVTETKDFHQISLDVTPGPHILTLVDEYGGEIVRHFRVLEDEAVDE